MSSQSWKPVRPDGAFWESLDPVISSTVAECLSPAVLDDINNHSTLSNPAKFELLEQALTRKLLSLEESANSSSLHDTDYPTWQRLNFALFHVLRGAGDAARQKETLLKLVHNPGPSGQDVAALQNLATLYEETGEHAQAEKLAKETLPLLRQHPALGQDSPQSLGSLRILIKALWKQGKEKEAEQVIQEASASIDRLAGGKFSDVQQEEKEALETVVADLKK
ncbi:hypothetical protein AFGD_011601 [Aspergillus flavus]|nr:hypothetical protein AFGD_011601 [Aspergillus flavus]